MSTKILTPCWLQVAGADLNGTSMAASITSDVVVTEFNDNIAIQCKWTGTPTGTIAIQISLDPTNLGWQTVPFSPAPTQPSGSASSDWFEINQTGAGFLRLVYTRVSGTGALYAKIAAKAL